MFKKFLPVVIVTIVVFLGVGGYWYYKKPSHPSVTLPNITALDPLNTTYQIEDEPVTLVNGRAETNSSSTTAVTTIFGQPTLGDLNGDGTPDAAVMLTEDAGGSGTFFYVAVAIKTTNGTQGTNPILLGDRIAPQNVEIKNGRIVVNYADRKLNEPMTTPPSVGVSAYLLLDGTVLKRAQPPTPTPTSSSTKNDLIRLDTPLPNQIITSPLIIKGQARGTWFFEASFPVSLTDASGKILAQGIAQAKSNWMTTEFVPFEAALTFTLDKKIANTTGTLILRKDNPSGLSEHDDALRVPVMFTKDLSLNQIKMCTQEVKQCADGSYVGRSGPTCAFARCPSPQK